MSGAAHLDNEYCLYQSPVSYYSAKVRSYLRYKGIRFHEVLSSDRVAREIIKPATGGWRVIPVLKTPRGEFIQDSSIILDELEAIHKQRSITPEGVKQKVVSALFELLGDEWLLFPAMHYRWSYRKQNLGHILRAFGNTRKPHWPAPIRWMGGIAPAMLFGSVAPMMLGLNKHNTTAMQQWTSEMLDQLDRHFSQHDYLLGGRPCYGDFALFGPVYAHLSLDPYPHEHLIKPRKHLSAWLQRMNQTPQDTGEWLADDEIPDTLIPLLQWQSRDQLPFVQRVMSKTNRWIKDNPEAEKLPRFIGKVEYQLGGNTGKRMCTPYSQWMYERVLKPLNSATDKEKQEVKAWLESHNVHLDTATPEVPLMFYRSRLWRRDALEFTAY